jgi:L-aspartate oxidase
VIAEDVVTAPAVVVGGGIAGLTTALSLEGSVLVADQPVGGGASQLAQGGIAAALGRDDSPAQHAADTLRVAAGLAEPDIAALVTEAAAERIDWLRLQGVEFDRTDAGGTALGREAGHGRDRIVHAGGDRTGVELMRALRRAALGRPDIRVIEGLSLVDIVSSANRAAGALLQGADGRRLAVVAPHTVLATGGIGACFDRSTNPATSRGAGLAAAARRGVRLADLEFVQFHPTALAVAGDPLPLLTEALRGAGAVLLDERGDRFMREVHPDAELAPRDVVARRVAELLASGRSTWLDASAVPDLAARFPAACELARRAGFDASRRPLPIATAAHFHMGGIATDAWGRSSLAGLWACGEVAATGLHGGNRLASNSLLEGLVFGRRIAGAIRAERLPLPQGALALPRRRAAGEVDPARIASLRRTIGESLGPIRSEAAMTRARMRIDRRTPDSLAEDDLMLVARLLIAAALARRESRGAHHRLDCPQPAPGLPRRSYLLPLPAPVESLSLARSRVA